MLAAVLDRLRGHRRQPMVRSRLRSRVALPAAREAHPDVLRQLRALHPGLDYYVNHGEVLLLIQRPDTARIAEGRKMIEAGVVTVDTLLMADGWALLASLDERAVEDGRLVATAQRLIDRTERAVREERARRLAESDGTAAEARAEAYWRDRVELQRNELVSFVFRGRRSFSGRSTPVPTSSAVRVIDRRTATTG